MCVFYINLVIKPQMFPAHLDIFKLQAAHQTEKIHKHGHKQCLLLVPCILAALKGFCQLDGQFQDCLGQREVGGGAGIVNDTQEVKSHHERLWFFFFTKTFHWCL